LRARRPPPAMAEMCAGSGRRPRLRLAVALAVCFRPARCRFRKSRGGACIGVRGCAGRCVTGRCGRAAIVRSAASARAWGGGSDAGVPLALRVRWQGLDELSGCGR